MIEAPENDFDLMLDYHGIKSHAAFDYNYTRAQQTQMFFDYFTVDLCKTWRKQGKQISRADLNYEREAYMRHRK